VKEVIKIKIKEKIVIKTVEKPSENFWDKTVNPTTSKPVVSVVPKHENHRH